MGAKNFYTYIAPDNHRGSRIIDLLSTYGLKDHLLATALDVPYDELALKALNQMSIIDIMIKERNRSCDFLNRYL